MKTPKLLHDKYTFSHWLLLIKTKTIWCNGYTINTPCKPCIQS